MIYKEFINTYLEKGLIKKQKTDFKAAEKFIAKAYRDLKTAEAVLNINEDVAYTTAYTAMLYVGRAFILSKGFRPDDGAQHKTVCDFTAKFLGDDYKIIVKKFDDMRKKRNILIYDVSLSVSRTETDDIMRTAKEFIKLISDMIKKENPQIKFNF